MLVQNFKFEQKLVSDISDFLFREGRLSFSCVGVQVDVFWLGAAAAYGIYALVAVEQRIVLLGSITGQGYEI